MAEVFVSKFKILRLSHLICFQSFSARPLQCTYTQYSPVRQPQHPISLLYLYPDRITGLLAKFDSLPTHQLKDPFPRALRNPTLELASSNLICSVALTGVLALQAGRLWAERADDDNDDAVVETEEVKGVKP